MTITARNEKGQIVSKHLTSEKAFSMFEARELKKEQKKEKQIDELLEELGFQKDEAGMLEREIARNFLEKGTKTLLDELKALSPRFRTRSAKVIKVQETPKPEMSVIEASEMIRAIEATQNKPALYLWEKLGKPTMEQVIKNHYVLVTPPKKRGRPKGSKNKPKPEPEPEPKTATFYADRMIKETEKDRKRADEDLRRTLRRLEKEYKK